MIPAWQPEVDLRMLNEHLENAFRRVSGLVGHKISKDLSNLSTLKGSASRVMDSATSSEPLFVRLSQGLSEACSFKVKNIVSLKELAAEILEEFYSAAQVAFQVSQLHLQESADTYLRDIAEINDETRRKAALAAADKTFILPSREDMTKAALPYVHQLMTPATMAWLFSGLGMTVLMFTLRHPVVTGVGGLLAWGIIYSCGRDRVCRQATKLLEKLPQNLYVMLRQRLVSNHHHYRDVINATTSSLPGIYPPPKI